MPFNVSQSPWSIKGGAYEPLRLSYQPASTTRVPESLVGREFELAIYTLAGADILTLPATVTTTGDPNALWMLTGKTTDSLYTQGGNFLWEISECGDDGKEAILSGTFNVTMTAPGRRDLNTGPLTRYDWRITRLNDDNPIAPKFEVTPRYYNPNPVAVNTVAPAITGNTTVGSTLTASSGTWSNSPTSYAYQWLRAGVAISGATASTYTLVSADAANAISVRVIATNAGGQSAPATSATVNAVAAPVAPTNTATPSISGTAAIGQALSVSTGTWSGSPTSYAYQWLRNATAITGATASSYTLVTADAGTSITAQVIATNAAGSSSPVVTSATSVPAAPVYTTAPSISPTSAVVGATFTANDGAASNTTSFTRRWLMNGTSIGTGTTVTPVVTGSLVLESTATGPGGGTSANSAAATVTSATPSALLMSSRSNLMGFNNYTPNATDTTTNSRLCFANETNATVSKLRIYNTNWYIGSSSGETDGSNALPITAAIEYPVGTFTPVTWGGASSVSIPATGTASTSESDEITLPTAIPANALFFVRTFVSVPSGGKWPRGYTINNQYNEAAEAGSGLTDKTMTGTITGTAFAYGPVAIKATAFSAGTPRTHAVALLGDSRVQGYADSVYYDFVNNGNVGGFARAMTGRAPNINMGVAASRANTQVVTTKRRALAKMAGCTDMINNLGVNDISYSLSASVTAGNLTTINTDWRNDGFTVYQCTIPVVCDTSTGNAAGNTSADYQISALIVPSALGGAGQFTGGASSQRSVLNASIRAGSVGATDYIELADALETARDSGKAVTGAEAPTYLFAPRTGTVQSGATTTSVPTGQTLALAFQLQGGYIVFTSGALSGTKAIISASTTNGILTVPALASAPAQGDTYTLYALYSGSTRDGIHEYRYATNGIVELGAPFIVRDAIRAKMTAKGW